MADSETTIKTSGGDYTSLYLAEDDDFGCSAGQTALCEYAEAMTDTTAVLIDTAVPSAIEISVQSAYRHNGDVSSGAALVVSSARALNIHVPVTIRHLRIDCTNVTTAGVDFYNISGNSYFNHLFVHDVQAGDKGITANANASNVVLGYRSISSSQATSGSANAFQCYSNATMNLYFCTGYSNFYTAFNNTSTMNAYGCAGYGNYAWQGTIGGDYNSDNEASAYQCPGANSQHNLTITDEHTDPANDDWSVKATSTGVKDNGYDYGSPYTDADIAGNAMSGTPDIGAFEYPAAGTEITIPKSSPAFTSKVPTVLATANVSITVPVSGASFTSKVPTVEAGANVEVEVPKSSPALSSKVPTAEATANQDITIPKADPQFSSKVPTVQAGDNQEVTVPKASPAFTSKVPTAEATTNFDETVPKAAASFTSKVPSAQVTGSQNVTVPKSDPSFTSKVPTVVAGDNQEMEVPATGLDLISLVPGVALPVGVTVPKTSPAFTSKVPVSAVTENVDVTVGKAAAVFTSKVPTVDVTTAFEVTVTAAALTLTSKVPEITAETVTRAAYIYQTRSRGYVYQSRSRSQTNTAEYKK